ncbi:MAG: hypothetical protein ACJ75J_09855 [Cytophagaceae bacterium]
MVDNTKNTIDTTPVVQPSTYDESTQENRFDVGRIAGKSKADLASYLGEPTSEEKVTVKGNIPDCDKAVYIDGMIEVIFIKGKADWIKINDDPEMVIIPAKNSYVSVEKFTSYVFVKASTK